MSTDKLLDAIARLGGHVTIRVGAPGAGRCGAGGAEGGVRPCPHSASVWANYATKGGYCD